MRHHDARVPAVLGVMTIAFSGPLVALAATSSTTATFWRCLLALPVLGLLLLVRRVWRGTAGDGAPTQRTAGLQVAAGVLLGVDMLLWSESILSVGAGVSTLLVNVQVVAVPVIALVAFGERIPPRFWLAVPVLLGGVGLAGGIADPAADGADPLYGTVTGVPAGVAYAGYLVLLRGAGASGDRFGGLVRINAAAGATALVAGLATSTLDATPGAVTLGWLVVLAVSGQVIGWLLIGGALPRLPASTGATILMLQPIAAVVIGMLALGERPSPLQLAGCAVVLVAVAAVTRTRREPVTGSPGPRPRPAR